MKTLLVDDDPAFRRLAAMAMDDAGIEHESVGNAAAALERIGVPADSRFDLLLLDQELPGMTGEELLPLLRKLGLEIPIVIVTVDDALSSKVRALHLGADDYIVKPFSFDELFARLRAVIRRSRSGHVVRFGDLEIDPRERRGPPVAPAPEARAAGRLLHPDDPWRGLPLDPTLAQRCPALSSLASAPGLRCPLVHVTPW